MLGEPASGSLGMDILGMVILGVDVACVCFIPDMPVPFPVAPKF